MRHGYLPWFLRMLELMIIPLHMMKNPSITFQFPNNISTIHDVYNTHRLKISQESATVDYASYRGSLLTPQIFPHNDLGKVFLDSYVGQVTKVQLVSKDFLDFQGLSEFTLYR